jgi:hypothetical protein
MLDHLLQNKTKITTKSSKLAILQRFSVVFSTVRHYLIATWLPKEVSLQ